ncbi:MAG: AMP-binding protein [Gammaproteobacteria bacterium]
MPSQNNTKPPHYPPPHNSPPQTPDDMPPVAHPPDSPFNAPELAQCRANFEALSPLSLIHRAARIHGDAPSAVYGDVVYTWRQTHERAIRLGRALQKAGIAPGDVVAVLLPNIPPFLEAMFGVPFCGAVLNPLNTRLDAASLAFILKHSGAKALLTDSAFAPAARAAVAEAGGDMLMVEINDPASGIKAAGLDADYESFIAGVDAAPFGPPADEWQALSLNYTSGTTGEPKGVVYSHRGAWLLATGNVLTWQMPPRAKYVWTLPMFHCCGWCFPWTLAAVAGASLCMRKVSAETIGNALEAGGEWLCGAPVVLQMLTEALESLPPDKRRRANFMVAAAPPSAAVIARAEAAGANITHAYGLTEVYGPAVFCDWQPEWNDKTADERAILRARQGAPYHALEGLQTADADGEALRFDKSGEVMMRGNIVMRGYFKNPAATRAAFGGGWFHSGDVGVMESDNYLRLTDRAKDIIISGGENISSIEVEDALCRHPAVFAAAVVAMADDKWGETPCAILQLHAGASMKAEDVAAHCRANLASYKCPRYVAFADIPRTITGKVQKFALRERLSSGALAAQKIPSAKEQ